jgi:hypothetical protein
VREIGSGKRLKFKHDEKSGENSSNKGVKGGKWWEYKNRKEAKQKNQEREERESNIQINEGEKVVSKRKWGIPKDNIKTP